MQLREHSGGSLEYATSRHQVIGYLLATLLAGFNCVLGERPRDGGLGRIA